MQIGIDFGTSYSAAAALVAGRLEHVRFGDQAQFRTAVYFPATVPDPDEFVLSDALEAEVEAQLRALRADQRRLGPSMQSDDDALRRMALRSVRHAWLERRVREARSAAVRINDAVFGDEAVEAYIADGHGHLVESPKSMLGYQLLPNARRVILHIATRLLEHLRLTATAQLGAPVRAATLGRPVEFKSSLGPEGTQQALDMLTEAALAAGFEHVEFMQEPAAAALHYHRQCRGVERSLIVDIGGGTTDLAYAEIGGAAAAPRVLGSWGLPRGGTDIDIDLSLHSFMPLFGRGEKTIPVHHFREAASVHSPPLQREFRTHRYRNAPVTFRDRLVALQKSGATSRLNREAEQAKIRLGTAPRHAVDLSFIEPDLRVELDAGHVRAAYADFLARLHALLERALGDIGERPDSIFLTGGSSRAPALQAAVRERFPDARLVVGDPSLGVVSGLAAAAAQAAPRARRAS